MKKGLLALSILLLLVSGLAFTFAFERFYAASSNMERAEKYLEEMKSAKDMATAQSANEPLKYVLEYASEAKKKGMMGAGVGSLLLIGSILFFVKSRRPKSGATV